MLEDIWDYICDGFDYFIHFEWFGDLKDGIGDFFSGSSDWFTTDSPVFNLWYWVFFILFALGIWVLPSAMKLPDYKLGEKIIASAVFLVIDFFIISHFKD